MSVRRTAAFVAAMLAVVVSASLFLFLPPYPCSALAWQDWLA